MLNKEEVIKLINVSENKWRKTSSIEKEQLINKAGYRLVSTSKEGRAVFYNIEPRGEELIKVQNCLIEFGFSRSTNFKALIKCLIIWKTGEPHTLEELSNKTGVTKSTISIWKKRLVEMNLLFVDEKSFAAKIKDSHAIFCTEKEWNSQKEQALKLVNIGIPFMVAWNNVYFETGYQYRKLDTIKANGFYNKFFSLLEAAAAQLEK